MPRVLRAPLEPKLFGAGKKSAALTRTEKIRTQSGPTTIRQSLNAGKVGGNGGTVRPAHAGHRSG